MDQYWQGRSGRLTIVEKKVREKIENNQGQKFNGREKLKRCDLFSKCDPFFQV